MNSTNIVDSFNILIIKYIFIVKHTYCTAVSGFFVDVWESRSIVMVEGGGCNRDDCPTTNLHPDNTTNCGKCNAIVHLMCIGIMRKTKEVIFHPSIKVFCRKCSPLDPKLAPSTSSATPKSSPIIKSSSFSSKGQPKITDFTMPTKIDELFALIQDVQHTVVDTNKKVSSHFEASKSYSDVLKEIKEATASTDKRLNSKESNALSYSAIAGQNNSLSKNRSLFPPLASRTPKRKREDNTPPPKSLFKSRTLVSGTDTTANHGLGDVVPTNATNMSKRVSPYAHLKKSIYISRLQPSVTAEKICDYIKSKMPLGENDVSLRMLVKKDQKVDDLTFISYRLSCTDENYDKFMEPSFWPAHVLIGEFIERERKPVNMDDFIAAKALENASKSPNLSGNKDNNDNDNTTGKPMETS